jgi:predicted RNA binding protein YcfA (HicA-like mRNA interferase family)
MMASEKRFSDVERMLEQAGYRLVRISGSHHYFTKPGEQPFSIRVHRGKVKPHYVREGEKVCQGN